MNGQTVAYPCNRTPLNKGNEPLTYMKSMAVSQNNYAKWKKPDNKRAHTVWLHLYETPENENFCTVTESRSMAPGDGRAGRGARGGFKGER